MIDIGQVEAIIAEVGGAAVRDVAQLRHDLDWARTWFVTRKTLKSDLPKRQAKVGQVEKTARKLSLLLADEDAWAAISAPLAEVDPDARTVVDLIASAARDYNAPSAEPEWATEAANRITAELGMHTLNAFDWLVAVHLAAIYQRHFDEPAGRSRLKDGQVGGPYVRFVQAALRELGILNNGKPYSAETIARSFSTARAHGEDRNFS